MASLILKPSLKKSFAVGVSTIAWVAVFIQLILRQGSIVNFLSYFTVLCNLLIAVSLTCSVFWPAFAIGKFFSRISVQSAIALYILIVGLVYNIVLRGIWVVTGLQWVVDNLLHVVVPVLYVLYWVVVTPKGSLKWKDGLYWTIFPTVYLIYSLVRGEAVGWYPYPFLDVLKHGYQQVVVNIVLMIAVFFGMGLLLIGLNRWMGKRLSK